MKSLITTGIPLAFVLSHSLACAGRVPVVDRTSALLSAAPPPQGRACAVAPNPVTLPPLGTLVDSVQMVRGATTEPGQHRGYALLSLRFDDQGQQLWVRVIESDLGADRLHAVEQLVARTLRHQAPTPSWSVRLKVTLDTAPELAVGHSEICPAMPADGRVRVVASRTVVTSRSATGSVAAAALLADQPQVSVPHFSLLVDVTGRVRQIRLARSSGEADVDEQAERSLEGREFLPTLLDGQPVVAWVPWPMSAR